MSYVANPEVLIAVGGMRDFCHEEIVLLLAVGRPPCGKPLFVALESKSCVCGKDTQYSVNGER